MKKLLIITTTLILLYAIGGVIFHFYHSSNDSVATKPLAKIDNYPYELKGNATKLMKDEFQILKKNLEGEDPSEGDYAESIAKLFIIDLYTISNKLNKYDIGGADYVLPSALDNYKLNVKDTLYKYVEDNADGKRKQTLPEVKTINVTEIAETKFKIDDLTYEGYIITVNWTYIKDLGYDELAEVTVIKEGEYFYVSAKN